MKFHSHWPKSVCMLVTLMLLGCTSESVRNAVTDSEKGNEGITGHDRAPAVVADGIAEVVDQPEDEPARWVHGKEGMDVQSVRFETDGSRLRVTVTLDKDFRSYLDSYGQGVTSAEIYLDTDNNDMTGGETFRGRRPGFEYKVKPLSGVSVRVPAGSGEAIMRLYEGGAPHALGITGYVASYSMSRLAAGKWPNEELIVRGDREEPQRASRIEGRNISIEVCYEQIGLESGDIIRIAVLENHAKAKRAVDKYLPDVLLRVR